MEFEESEHLFLLEFLVDKIRMKRTDVFPNSHIDSIPSQLTTTFQFLKFPPLEIREEDQHNKGDEVVSFRTGKSCLFAIPCKRLVDLSKIFNLNVSVARRFPPGVLPEKTVFGGTTVDISSDFAHVVTEALSEPHAIPKSKATRSVYALRSFGENLPIGCIALYIRVSCFGKLIVNEFQLREEDSVVLRSEQRKEEIERRTDDRGCSPFRFAEVEEVVGSPGIEVKRSCSECSGAGEGRAKGAAAESPWRRLGQGVRRDPSPLGPAWALPFRLQETALPLFTPLDMLPEPSAPAPPADGKPSKGKGGKGKGKSSKGERRAQKGEKKSKKRSAV